MNLDNLESYLEGNRLEAKAAQGGIPGSVWETISAFANTAGGIILLGVKERADKSLEAVGLKNASKMLDDFWNAAHSKDKLSDRIFNDSDASIQEVNGKEIIVIEVPRVDRHSRPIFLNKDILGSTYRRTHTGDHLCTRAEVQSMLRDAETTSEDKRIAETVDISCLNADTINRYRRRFQGRNENHIWNGLNDEDFLRSIGAIKPDAEGTMRPTRAGLLMFGNESCITDEFQHYLLDYRQETSDDTRWEDRFVSFSGDWSGNVYDFYYRAYDKLKQALKVPFKLEGVDRVDDTPAHEALREALINCLTNANYHERRGIVCAWRNDALVIENPGDFRIPLEEAMQPGESDPRNETMLKMFSLVDLGERAGSGISKIISGWKDSGYAPPSYIEKYGPDRTMLTLPLMPGATEGQKAKIAAEKSGGKKAAEKKRRKTPKTIAHEEDILHFLETVKHAKTSEIAQFIGLGETRTKEILASLAIEGRLTAENAGRSRVYKRAHQ